jgi:DNA polymerase elongation subunit (family B)
LVPITLLLLLLPLLPLLLLRACLQVMSFESEAEMLKRWTSLVLETDPDIITGAPVHYV